MIPNATSKKLSHIINSQAGQYQGGLISWRFSLDPVSLSAVKETEVCFRGATAVCADVQQVTDADFDVFLLIFIMEEVPRVLLNYFKSYYFN